jgi:hypothetical protein
LYTFPTPRHSNSMPVLQVGAFCISATRCKS